MPQKLNVGESLAFLIACIDASGRLDFKRLGDNLEIQPAAARMRLTRLRKAVANREFEDAILVQPGKLDPEIAALANPDSRKLTAAASKARRSRKANKHVGESELSPALVLDSDSDFEDELEDELEDEDEAPAHQASASLIERIAKRKALSEPLDDSGEDETLFYKDTSSASRRAKQIKLEEDETNTKVEESKDAGDAVPHANKAAQDVLAQKNGAPLDRGRTLTRPSAAEYGSTAHARAPSSVVSSMHDRDKGIPLAQGVQVPPSWSKPRYDRRPVMARADIDRDSVEAYLAQRAPRPPHQPARRGVFRLIGGRLVGGGDCWSSWDPPTRQPSPNPRPTTRPAAHTKPSFSSPASVFADFRPAKPSPFAVSNPATKRVIIPKDRQTPPPMQKAGGLVDVLNKPHDLLDPVLRGSQPNARAESITSRSSGKRMVVRPRENTSHTVQNQGVKEEN